MTRLARSRAVAGLTLGLALTTGCSTNRGGTGPAPQQAIDGTTSAGDLMSERDRAALAAVSKGPLPGGARRLPHRAGRLARHPRPEAPECPAGRHDRVDHRWHRRRAIAG